MLEQKGIYAVHKNNLSLLEGLEFTPPSSARTKRDIHVPGTYINIFFLIFRLMIYTYVFFFSLSGVLFTREYTIPQLNATVKQDKIREEPENRMLRHTVMFARAFGIFCCFCLISYHLPGTWQFVVYLSFRGSEATETVCCLQAKKPLHSGSYEHRVTKI